MHVYENMLFILMIIYLSCLNPPAPLICNIAKTKKECCVSILCSVLASDVGDVENPAVPLHYLGCVGYGVSVLPRLLCLFERYLLQRRHPLLEKTFFSCPLLAQDEFTCT